MPAFDKPLREEDVDSDPFAQFERWCEEARAAGVRAPEAAALATASADGAPSVRIVLVKRPFVFFTNYESRKGRELEDNPRAALLFHWDPLGRQVRVEGRVERLSPEESEAYVRTRPRGSRLSALASPQSRTVESRQWLERRVAELAAAHGDELPIPADWGGYRLDPVSFELWQHRVDRLHDRLMYRRTAAGAWTLERLAP